MAKNVSSCLEKVIFRCIIAKEKRIIFAGLQLRVAVTWTMLTHPWGTGGSQQKPAPLSSYTRRQPHGKLPFVNHGGSGWGFWREKPTESQVVPLNMSLRRRHESWETHWPPICFTFEIKTSARKKMGFSVLRSIGDRDKFPQLIGQSLKTVALPL